MKKEIGKPSTTEKIVACIFFLTATLWIFRKTLNEKFNFNLNDTSIGILGALAFIYNSLRVLIKELVIGKQQIKFLGVYCF